MPSKTVNSARAQIRRLEDGIFRICNHERKSTKRIRLAGLENAAHPLFQLPECLRNRIYFEVLDESECNAIPGAMHGCQQMRQETLPLYYASTKLCHREGKGAESKQFTRFLKNPAISPATPFLQHLTVIIPYSLCVRDPFMELERFVKKSICTVIFRWTLRGDLYKLEIILVDPQGVNVGDIADGYIRMHGYELSKRLVSAFSSVRTLQHAPGHGQLRREPDHRISVYYDRQ